uniref:Uncharacterized protein n=1 Tax=Rhizophora mucronata TaxID=61149 RepID=A0A2P2IIX8_RHIMU
MTMECIPELTCMRDCINTLHKVLYLCLSDFNISYLLGRNIGAVLVY